MAGMWIAAINVTDEDTYSAYVAVASQVLKSHGAVFIARGGRYRQMEGTDRSRNVIATFPTFEAAVACYGSEEYQAVVGDAIEASDRIVVIVETDD